METIQSSLHVYISKSNKTFFMCHHSDSIYQFMTDITAILYMCYFALHVFLLYAHYFFFPRMRVADSELLQQREIRLARNARGGSKKHLLVGDFIFHYPSPYFVARKCRLSCHARISLRRCTTPSASAICNYAHYQ